MKESDENRPLRILVVENHHDTLEALKLYLEDSGYEVFTSMTVQTAARIFSQTNCEILICDIGLPDGTGWDLMLQLKALSHHPFAIAMSGFGMNADNVRSLAAGFRYHLLKPFKSAELDKILVEASSQLRNLEYGR